jgi:hypothetical protein
MAQDNPTNPFTQDPNHTSKDVQMPIQKARVLSAKGHPQQNGFHTVRIRVYGDEAPYLAPVVTPMPGSVWVPKEGTDVAVMFTQSGKPWVIGSWYALDRIEDGEVDLPEYEPGDIRVGNHTGSYVTVRDNGAIKIETGGLEPIDIDHQSGSVRMSTDQTIPGDDTYTLVNFDTVQDDPEDLFNTSTHSFTVLHAGQHRVEATVEVASAGQNNLYTVGMFADDTLVKRKRRQSVVNEPMSINVSTTRLFADDTDIDIRMRQDSGSNKIIDSSNVATEFTIERHGI